MTRPEWIEALRADVRAVDPDPVLLAQLVELSSRSVAPAPRPGRSAGARLAMVLGGVIAVGATSWAAGALPGTTSPFSPEERITHQPTDPTPDERAPGRTPAPQSPPSGGPASPGDRATPASPTSRDPDRSERSPSPEGPPTSPGREGPSGPPDDLPTVPQLPVTPAVGPDVRPGVEPEVPAEPEPPGLERFPDAPPPPAPPQPDDEDALGELPGDSDSKDDSNSDSGPGRSPQPQEELVHRTR